MIIDNITRQAIKHTTHCLIGCGIGEILGMVIAASFGWHRIGRLSLAIILAFLIGYSLTYRGVRKHVSTPREAVKITAATDTVSIATMEIVDNTIELIIPNALLVTVASFRFWWGLALSLSIAFIITVPVNRYMMGKSSHRTIIEGSNVPHTLIKLTDPINWLGIIYEARTLFTQTPLTMSAEFSVRSR